MADLTIEVTLDASGVRKGAEQAKSFVRSIANADFKSISDNLTRIGTKMTQFGGAMQSVGTQLSLAITAPLALAGKAILTAGGEYEKALNIFQSVTKASGDEMARAAERAKELGSDLTLPATSAKDAALAMTELGKAGFTASQAIEASKGVLQLAAAGALDEARAAEVAANALNAFGLEAKEATRIADLLAAAANASSAEVDDIALAMTQASASFAAAKIPIEDLTTAISAMANAGIKGSDAGTSLKTFILRLQAPTSEASRLMKELGINVFDAAGKMRAMPDIIGQFETALAGLTDEQKTQALNTIFGTDAIRAAQVLFATGTEGFNKLKDAVTEAGAAGELANARMKGLSGAWEGFKSQLETIGIEIFEVVKAPLTNFLRTAADAAGQLTDWFVRLSPAIQQIIIAGVALVAAAGPVLVIVGTLVTAVGSIISAAGAIAGAVAAIGGLGVALLVVIGVITQIGTILAIVSTEIAALYLAWQTNFGGIRDLTAIVVEAVKAAWAAMLAAISDLTTSVMAEVQAFWAENGADIMKTVGELSDFIRSVWTAIVDFWRDNNETIKAIASAVWGVIKTVVTTAVKVIADVISLALKLINGDWAGAWEKTRSILLEVTKAWVTIVLGIQGALLNAFKLVFQAVLNLQGWIIEKGKEIGVALVQGVISGIGSMGGPLGSAAARVINGALNRMRGEAQIHSPSRVTHQMGIYIIEGLTTGMEAGLPGAEASAAKTTKTLLNRINNVVFNGDFRGFIERAFDIMLDRGKSFGDKLKEIFGGIVRNFQQMLSRMFSDWINAKLFGGSGSSGGIAIPGFPSSGSGGTPPFNPAGTGGGSTGGSASSGSAAGGGFGGHNVPGAVLGISAVGSMVGGALGGTFGNVLSLASTGLGIGWMIGGPIGGAIGAGIGAVGGFLMSLFGGDPKRKKDKKENMPQLQKGFQQAIADLERLKNDRMAIYNDPDGALSRARDIRTQIAAGFGIEFLSKKYRKIAQQQISQKLIEADKLIAELEQIAGTYKYARQVDERLVTSFAGGVFMSPAFMKQFSEFKRRNGFLGGRFTGVDTLPSMLAPGEMVLNPYQVARVKSNAGMDPFASAGIPGYGSGLSVPSSPAPMSGAALTPSIVVSPTVQITIEGEGISDARIKSVVVDGMNETDFQVSLAKAASRGQAFKPRSY
ncbi:MAG: phage tail tape measure protein [Pyrinomonadaceae bacterium]